MIDLKDLADIINRTQSKFGWTDDAMAEWLATAPYYETETGHQFEGKPYADQSESNVKKKSATISTKDKSRTKSIIAHEAQHLMDYVGRDDDTVDKMMKDYRTTDGDDEAYRKHHAEVRAKARELLSILQDSYEKDPKGASTFRAFAHDVLRTIPVSEELGGKKAAAYMYKFIDDENGRNGETIGIGNLPSDRRLKLIKEEHNAVDKFIDDVISRYKYA